MTKDNPVKTKKKFNTLKNVYFIQYRETQKKEIHI